MSLLDDSIAHVRSVRNGLAAAARMVVALPGPVLLLGLGNGRVLDHIRLLFPGREVYCYDEVLKRLYGEPLDTERVIIGDLATSLHATLGRLPVPAAFACVNVEETASRHSVMPPHLFGMLEPLLGPDAAILSQLSIDNAGWTEVGRFFTPKGWGSCLYCRADARAPSVNSGPVADAKNLDSLLDRLLTRMVSQKLCLEMAVHQVEHLTGPVIELGLSNGRTYDHLQSLMPNRSIFVLDYTGKTSSPRPPDPGYLIVGEARETLPGLLGKMGEPASLINYDLGSTDRRLNAQLAEDLEPSLLACLAPGGVLVSVRRFHHPTLRQLDTPAGADPYHYHAHIKIR